MGVRCIGTSRRADRATAAARWGAEGIVVSGGHFAEQVLEMTHGRGADVIADLVGVPEADRKQVFDWTEMTFGFDPAVTPEQRNEAAMHMYMYADQMCVERQDNPKDDLISVLMQAEVDGERLTAQEFGSFFILLVVAGNETTCSARA